MKGKLSFIEFENVQNEARRARIILLLKMVALLDNNVFFNVFLNTELFLAWICSAYRFVQNSPQLHAQLTAYFMRGNHHKYPRDQTAHKFDCLCHSSPKQCLIKCVLVEVIKRKWVVVYSSTWTKGQQIFLPKPAFIVKLNVCFQAKYSISYI